MVYASSKCSNLSLQVVNTIRCIQDTRDPSRGVWDGNFTICRSLQGSCDPPQPESNKNVELRCDNGFAVGEWHFLYLPFNPIKAKHCLFLLYYLLVFPCNNHAIQLQTFLIKYEHEIKIQFLFFRFTLHSCLSRPVWSVRQRTSSIGHKLINHVCEKRWLAERSCDHMHRSASVVPRSKKDHLCRRMYWGERGYQGTLCYLLK